MTSVVGEQVTQISFMSYSIVNQVRLYIAVHVLLLL